MSNFKITKTKKTILAALLLAMFIVFDRFLSINQQSATFNLSAIPVMLAGLILGPYYAILVAGLGDLIGATVLGFGAYNPIFTLLSSLSGLIYGIFLYNKNLLDNQNQKSNRIFMFKVILSNLIVSIGINLFLKSYAFKLMYKKAFIVYLTQRVFFEMILLPINILVIIFLIKKLPPILKKYVYKIKE